MKQLSWHDLDSTVLVRAAYHNPTRALHVVFASPNIPEYVYLGVPRNRWRTMLAAPEKGKSAGSYFNQRVKGQFEAQRVA